MTFLHKINPRIVIGISLVIGVVMVLSAYVELVQSRNEIFHLLEEHALSLSETITSSSNNAMNASREIDNLVTERLLINARMVRVLDSIDVLTHQKLIALSQQNNIFRINLFDPDGNRVLTNRVFEYEQHGHSEENVNRYNEIAPILTGRVSELVIGLKSAMHVDEKRFAVAVARSGKRGAIVVNMNADDYLLFRERIGIEKFIREMGDNSEIEYIVLQDSSGILASTDSAGPMSSFSDDLLLSRSTERDSTFLRITGYGNREVLEVVRGLFTGGAFVGSFRIGISLDEIRSVEARMVTRIIVLSVIFAAISIIVLSIIFTNQSLRMVTREFRNLQSITNSFLSSMNEAVITIDSSKRVTLFNHSAERLFFMNRDEIINKPFSLLTGGDLRSLVESITPGKTYKNIEAPLRTRNGERILSVTLSPNYSLHGESGSSTLILSDITESKRAEEQAKRREKLLAMGELASAVAHEVRNPMNAIGMIAQRLSQEFSPKEDPDEYNSITALLKSEVERTNRIITQFLLYAKPLPLEVKRTNITALMDDIGRLFEERARQSGIALKIDGPPDTEVRLDPQLFRQVLMNIVRNAFEATPEGGKVDISYQASDRLLVVRISDTGRGIREEDENKVFDLYFTTRESGTGLGLSIAQKIVSQHNGFLEFTSGSEGTIFTITIPTNHDSLNSDC